MLCKALPANVAPVHQLTQHSATMPEKSGWLHPPLRSRYAIQVHFCSTPSRRGPLQRVKTKPSPVRCCHSGNLFIANKKGDFFTSATNCSTTLKKNSPQDYHTLRGITKKLCGQSCPRGCQRSDRASAQPRLGCAELQYQLQNTHGALTASAVQLDKLKFMELYPTER